MSEIKKVTNESTIDINWKNEDLIMIDNKRFMHGRRKINKEEKRDIINIQPLKSNF